MSKAKKGTKENPVTLSDLKAITENLKPFVIKDAVIKDDFCNYSYEIVSGIGVGDIHKVNGKGIIKDDMRDAMAAFNVHLACIDDVFKHSGIEVTDIDAMRSHEHTFLYVVTGFKVKGSKEDESIIIVGQKYVSGAGGRIEIETPKIPLDNSSSYKWQNELKAVADRARKEVELYKEGKYTAVETEVEEDHSAQITIFHNESAEKDYLLEDDFAEAKL